MPLRQKDNPGILRAPRPLTRGPAPGDRRKSEETGYGGPGRRFPVNPGRPAVGRLAGASRTSVARASERQSRRSSDARRCRAVTAFEVMSTASELLLLQTADVFLIHRRTTEGLHLRQALPRHHAQSSLLPLHLQDLVGSYSNQSHPFLQNTSKFHMLWILHSYALDPNTLGLIVLYHSFLLL